MDSTVPLFRYIISLTPTLFSGYHDLQGFLCPPRDVKALLDFAQREPVSYHTLHVNLPLAYQLKGFLQVFGGGTVAGDIAYLIPPEVCCRHGYVPV